MWLGYTLLHEAKSQEAATQATPALRAHGEGRGCTARSTVERAEGAHSNGESHGGAVRTG